MKFRKKPVVIDAWQVPPNPQQPPIPAPAWLMSEVCNGVVQPIATGGMLIRTLEGEMRADVDDWIIKGVKGELYPCKPDIFAATYDPVTSNG
jgi:hypothetical protein